LQNFEKKTQITRKSTENEKGKSDVIRQIIADESLLEFMEFET